MKREYENGELRKVILKVCLDLPSTSNLGFRVRLSGGDRKPLSAKLEELLLEWIENRRARGLRVSCKLIMKKAEVSGQRRL